MERGHERSGTTPPGDGRRWTAKLAAWLHDPAEKALILMRANHEEDSSVARLRGLFFEGGVPEDMARLVRLADHWASAADRPALPRPGDLEFREALDIRFWSRDGGVLIHPLDGTEYRIADLYTAPAGEIEKSSFLSLFHVLNRAGVLETGEDGALRLTIRDPRSAFLALWRLGPESPPPGTGLGHLWRHLPADTRIPDHSIWEHLSLASAFAGAMAADPGGNPALLAVSLGPVQSFIAQARSTSDLWAGSHLLARLSWEAMKVICERHGPDAVIFPSLWGVPLVDVWLEEQGVPFPEGGDAPEWKRSASDANPLFQAALPNRFVAVVPAAEARETAEAITEAVRSWMAGTAREAAGRLLEAAGYGPDTGCDLWRQTDRQLEGFPEVHWAVVPFAPLVEWSEEEARRGTKTTVTGVEGLREALARFHPEGEEPGFLGSEQWKLLQEAIEGEGIVYVPNPGVLYPALYDLLDRLVAAAKTARPFLQVREEGYRCTLCGEREWLRGPGDEGKGREPRGGRGESLWTRVAAARRAWAREGEHLCAPCATKRLWPTVFSEWAARAVPGLGKERLDRYVVSTHTMALARDLHETAEKMRRGEVPECFAELKERLHGYERVVLPKKVHNAMRQVPDAEDLARVPALLDDVAEDENERRRVASLVEKVLGHRPEAYYALLLFDGDRMGAWVSGTDPELALPFGATWHPEVVRALGERARGDDRLGRYLKTSRPPSPARHAAISSALNGFSLHVARWVVEELFAGKLISAGGDDVLAMLPVDDVLPCLLVLRSAYSGVVPGEDREAIWELYGEVKGQLTRIRRGHVLLGGQGERLFRMMGARATGSAGVVIAHHQAPLAAVLRELRAAEGRAKDEGGRNAFSVSLVKRAGGTTHFTAGFGFGGPGWEPAAERPTALGGLFALRDTLATRGVSRRAAYNVLAWLPGLPERPDPSRGLDGEAYRELLERNLAWQLVRHGVDGRAGFGPGFAGELARRLVDAAVGEAGRRGERFSYTGFLHGLFTVAEFLAREGRTVERRKGDGTTVAAGAAEGGAA